MVTVTCPGDLRVGLIQGLSANVIRRHLGQSQGDRANYSAHSRCTPQFHPGTGEPYHMMLQRGTGVHCSHARFKIGGSKRTSFVECGPRVERKTGDWRQHLVYSIPYTTGTERHRERTCIVEITYRSQ